MVTSLYCGGTLRDPLAWHPSCIRCSIVPRGPRGIGHIPRTCSPRTWNCAACDQHAYQKRGRCRRRRDCLRSFTSSSSPAICVRPEDGLSLPLPDGHLTERARKPHCSKDNGHRTTVGKAPLNGCPAWREPPTPRPAQIARHAGEGTALGSSRAELRIHTEGGPGLTPVWGTWPLFGVCLCGQTTACARAASHQAGACDLPHQASTLMGWEFSSYSISSACADPLELLAS